jgi:anti-sigma factor RsiW
MIMTDKHEHLDEGTIHAWLDGALSPDESARVEALAGACAECAALVAEARGLVAASSRILSSLDTIPGGVIPGAEVGVDQLAALRARRSATTRHWWSDRRIVVAASLVFVAGVSSVVWRFAYTDAVTSMTEQTVDAVQPFADSARPVVTAPPAPATPSATIRPVRRQPGMRQG